MENFPLLYTKSLVPKFETFLFDMVVLYSILAYVYGLKGLAKILGCSRTTASKIKNSGMIDDAISQVGKLIVIDKKKVLEIIAKENEL